MQVHGHDVQDSIQTDKQEALCVDNIKSGDQAKGKPLNAVALEHTLPHTKTPPQK